MHGVTPACNHQIKALLAIANISFTLLLLLLLLLLLQARDPYRSTKLASRRAPRSASVALLQWVPERR